MKLDICASDWTVNWPQLLAVVHGTPADDAARLAGGVCNITVIAGLTVCCGDLALQVSWHAGLLHHCKHDLCTLHCDSDDEQSSRLPMHHEATWHL